MDEGPRRFGVAAHLNESAPSGASVPRQLGDRAIHTNRVLDVTHEERLPVRSTLPGLDPGVLAEECDGNAGTIGQQLLASPAQEIPIRARSVVG